MSGVFSMFIDFPGNFKSAIQYAVGRFRDPVRSKQVVEGRLHARSVSSLVEASLFLVTKNSRPLVVVDRHKVVETLYC
jgi:hypothetical protein